MENVLLADLRSEGTLPAVTIEVVTAMPATPDVTEALQTTMGFLLSLPMGEQTLTAYDAESEKYSCRR